jgi:hypothetical protein
MPIEEREFRIRPRRPRVGRDEAAKSLTGSAGENLESGTDVYFRCSRQNPRRDLLYPPGEASFSDNH